MKYILLGITLTDELGLKSVTIDANSTELSSDSTLIKNVALAILKSFYAEKENIELQDILNEAGISISKDAEKEYNCQCRNCKPTYESHSIKHPDCFNNKK